jgi:predicted dehydrogenase
VKVAIIGAGTMGSIHAKAWLAQSGVEIAAIGDIDGERAGRLAEECGTRPAATYEEAIDHSGVEAVSVCVPVNLHPEVTCYALDHGKHVLCEKPIALTLAEADRMIEAAERNRRFLGVSYQYRCFEYYAEIRRRFRAGDFGGPIFAQFTDVREVRPKLAMHRRSMNGGPIIDMAGHFFDLMRFITEEEPQKVSARGHIFGAGKARLAAIEDLAVDAADIQVTMTGGHVLHAFVNWGMPEGFGGSGGFAITGPQLEVRMSAGVVEARFRGRKEVWSDFATLFPVATACRVADLIQSIREERQPEVSGAEGRRALEVSLAALRSIESGNEVLLG